MVEQVQVQVRGVAYAIPKTLFIGDSFFVPTIDRALTIRTVSQRLERFGYTIKGEERIENGVLGVRLWRVL